MIVYRVIQARYLSTALSTIGAFNNSGRWHYEKNDVLYCSTSPELALLEVLAHYEVVPLRDMEPLMVLTIDIPDDLTHYDVGDLPIGWNDLLDQTASRDFLRAWVESPDTLAVTVPSVIMPLSMNLLLNAKHPLQRAIELIRWEPVNVDPRIWKHQQRPA